MNRRPVLAFLGIALTSLGLFFLLQDLRPASLVAQEKSKLLVSAAISLKDALEEIKLLYRSQSGITITYNFGASGALQQQIENGAPVDLFISAAKRQMDALQEKNLIVPATRTNLVANRLVLIVPQDSRLGIKSFSNLSDPAVKRIAIGEPRSVPAGQYAEQTLKKLKVWDRISNKVVLTNNVRQVLISVESGNADAGLVYLTDAKTSTKVKVVAIARETDHAPIVYPIAVIRRSKNVNAARGLIRFLTGKQARGVFQKYGFTLPR